MGPAAGAQVRDLYVLLHRVPGSINLAEDDPSLFMGQALALLERSPRRIRREIGAVVARLKRRTRRGGTERVRGMVARVPRPLWAVDLTVIMMMTIAVEDESTAARSTSGGLSPPPPESQLVEFLTVAPNGPNAAGVMPAAA